jgi:hypothetical protein
VSDRLLGLALDEIGRLDGRVASLTKEARSLREWRDRERTATSDEVVSLRTQLETALKAAAALAPHLDPAEFADRMTGLMVGVPVNRTLASAEAFLEEALQDGADGPVVAEARRQLREAAKAPDPYSHVAEEKDEP